MMAKNQSKPDREAAWLLLCFKTKKSTMRGTVRRWPIANTGVRIPWATKKTIVAKVRGIKKSSKFQLKLFGFSWKKMKSEHSALLTYRYGMNTSAVVNIKTNVKHLNIHTFISFARIAVIYPVLFHAFQPRIDSFNDFVLFLNVCVLFQSPIHSHTPLTYQTNKPWLVKPLVCVALSV